MSLVVMSGQIYALRLWPAQITIVGRRLENRVKAQDQGNTGLPRMLTEEVIINITSFG